MHCKCISSPFSYHLMFSNAIFLSNIKRVMFKITLKDGLDSHQIRCRCNLFPSSSMRPLTLLLCCSFSAQKICIMLRLPITCFSDLTQAQQRANQTTWHDKFCHVNYMSGTTATKRCRVFLQRRIQCECSLMRKKTFWASFNKINILHIVGYSHCECDV